MGVHINPFTGKLDVVDSPSGEFTDLTLDAGTASAPSISFDPDTGIYSPGADQVAISTNGTGRLFVDSSGRVGVGVTSVNTTLEVLNSSTPIIRVGDGTRHMELRGGSTTQNAAIGTAYAGGFDFIQNSSPVATIDSSGRLGLGTSTPAELLHVNGAVRVQQNITATNASLRLGSNGNTNAWLEYLNNATDINGIVDIQSTDSYGQLRTRSTRPLVLNGTAGGNVGVGTTSPGGTLDVKAASSTAPLIVQGPSSEFARIDSSGRLLVGTSSSLDFGSQTQVAGIGANFEVFRFSSISGNVGASVDFARSGSFTVGTLAAVSSSQGLGIMRFRGAGDASTWLTGAQIEAVVESGTVSSTSMPTRLVFSVTADGASSPIEAMRIKNSRILNFANTPVYADNAAAKTGGLVDGDVYRKSDGTLMIVYT